MKTVPKINLFKTAVQKVIEDKVQNPDSERSTLNLESPNITTKRRGKSLFVSETSQGPTTRGVNRSNTLGKFINNLIGQKEPSEPSSPRKSSKLQSLISSILRANRKVTPVQKELGPEVIKHKFQRAFHIIRVMSRLYRIAEDIQLYGTSSNLYDLTTRDRTRVQKLLYTSVIDETEMRLSEERDMKWFVLHPKNRLRQVWSIVVIIMLTYTAIFTPYRLTFEDEIPYGWKILDYFVDCLFFLDILMNFLSAYYDEEGRLVKDLGTLAKKYIKSWFLIDLVAVIPFDLIQSWFIEEHIISPTQANLNTFFRLLRLPRLYRLAQLIKINHIFKFIKGTKFVEWIELNSIAVKLFGFFLTVVSLMHIMACIWYFIAKMADNSDTWIAREGLIGSENSSIYIASLYYIFVILATVGYGDINAVTIPERIFSLFLMVMGVAFYSFTIAMIANVISSRENRESALKRKISIANEFADQIKAPRSLKSKIAQILEYNSFRNCFSWAGKRELFSEIPITLRHEIVMSMHNGILSAIPFFREHTDKYFIVTVAEMLKPLQVAARDFLWKEGDSSESMYFLISGKVHLLSLEYLTPEDRINNVKGSIIFKRFMAGCYFGEIEILNKTKRSYSLQASTEAELFYLTKHDYYNAIIPEFPHIHEELKEIAYERDKRNTESLREIRNFLHAHIPEEKKGSRILTSRSNSNIGIKDISNYLKPGFPHSTSIELPRRLSSFGPERRGTLQDEINLLNQSSNSLRVDIQKKISLGSKSSKRPSVGSYISVENLPPKLRTADTKSTDSLISSFPESESLSSILSESSNDSSSVNEKETSLVNDIRPQSSKSPNEIKSKTLSSISNHQKSEIEVSSAKRLAKSKSSYRSPIISENDVHRRKSLSIAVKNALIITSEGKIGKKKKKNKERSLLKLAAGLDTEEPSSPDTRKHNSQAKSIKEKIEIKSQRRISFADEINEDKTLKVLNKAQERKEKEKQKADHLNKNITSNDLRMRDLENKLQGLIQNMKDLIV